MINTKNIGSVIKAHLLFLILSVIILGWTWFCVYQMWYSDRTERPFGTAGQFGNNFSDLPTNLTYMVFELSIFVLILRPNTYHLRNSVYRAAFLVLPMIPLWAFHMFQLMHAGGVNAGLFLWWSGLVGLTIILIVIGVVLRRYFNNGIKFQKVD
jgi:hypothetical protein